MEKILKPETHKAIVKWLFDQSRREDAFVEKLQGLGFTTVEGEANGVIFDSYDVLRLFVPERFADEDDFVDEFMYGEDFEAFYEKWFRTEPISEDERLYREFRRALDAIWIPEVLNKIDTTPILHEGQQVGILCTKDVFDWMYIDALYIRPEYRRTGLGRKTVLEWLKKQIDEEIRLHIINKNEVARAFWNSIFELEEIERNEIETLYRVKEVKSCL